MAYKPYRNFKWPISTYWPGALAKRSEKELRQEYARLRAVAQKSIQRLGKSEFAGGATYRNAVGRFKTTKSITDKRELSMALVDVSRFLSAKGSSVSGLKEIRAEQVNTWQNQYGYDFVNAANYSAWVEFLEVMRDSVGFIYQKVRNRRYVNIADSQARKAEIEQKFQKFLQNRS
jgi:hypothetical protein